jgi:hypothetical protein
MRAGQDTSRNEGRVGGREIARNYHVVTRVAVCGESVG